MEIRIRDVVQNVLLILIVLQTRHAKTINAMILVLERAGKMPYARLLIMCLTAIVFRALLAILIDTVVNPKSVSFLAVL